MGGEVVVVVEYFGYQEMGEKGGGDVRPYLCQRHGRADGFNSSSVLRLM